MSEIKKYLELVVGFYTKHNKPGSVKFFGAHDFILNNGKEYTKLGGIKKGKLDQQCYFNAYKYSERKGLTYVEGLANMGPIPFPVFHAWCVDESGKVFDPTWGDQGIEYFGVEISPIKLAKIYVLTEVYDVFESFWHYEAIEKILLKEEE